MIRRKRACVFSLSTALLLSACGEDKKGNGGGTAASAVGVPADFKSETLTQAQAGTKAKSASTAMAEIESTFGLADFTASLAPDAGPRLRFLGRTAARNDASELEEIKVGDTCAAAVNALGTGAGAGFHKAISSLKGFVTLLAAVEQDKLPTGFTATTPRDARASVAFSYDMPASGNASAEKAHVLLSLGASGNQVFLVTNITVGTSISSAIAMLVDTEKKTLRTETAVTADLNSTQGGGTAVKTTATTKSAFDALAKTIHEESNAVVDAGDAGKGTLASSVDVAAKSDTELGIKGSAKADATSEGQTTKETYALDATFTRAGGQCTVSAWSASKS